MRGDIEATKHIKKMFPGIGPEKVRRMYEVLPLAAKWFLLDGYFEQTLLRNLNLKKGFGKKVVNYLVGNKESKETSTSKQLLEGFLYAIEEVGDKPFQRTVLSYLYAMPKSSQESPGEVLKQILEVFGATGIKVGQFLVAAQLLPEKETNILRDLQERAAIPNREDVYTDIRDILDISEENSSDIPFKILDFIGAASLKYAFLAKEKTSGKDFVIKVFREEAIHHVRTQFALLNHMTDYLRKNYGAKYGILKSIIEAAQRAVEKELDIEAEAEKSRYAREELYADFSDEEFDVLVPKERMLKDRLIMSLFADGGSFNDLPDSYKPNVARKILAMESEILFAENKEEIIFDPDRHGGNYRVFIHGFHTPATENSQINKSFIAPIDFGQLMPITASQREEVIKLFALSQVITHAGQNSWIVDEIGYILNLKDEAKARLSEHIALYFPDDNFKEREVLGYFALLSAVRESGHELDIPYFDYVRGVIQLTQYEKYVDESDVSPSRIFAEKIEDKINTYVGKVEWSNKQKIQVGLHNAWAKSTNWLPKKKIEPIDLTNIKVKSANNGFSFNKSNCESALDDAS